MRLRLIRDTFGGTDFTNQWKSMDVRGYGRIDLTQYMSGTSGSCVDLDDVQLIQSLLNHHLFGIQRLLDDGNPNVQFRLLDTRLMNIGSRIEKTLTELNDYRCIAASGKYLVFAQEAIA